MQETKEIVCKKLEKALLGLMESVKENSTQNIFSPEDGGGISMAPPTTATTSYSIGPELDRHINTIIKNSRAVAHVSRDKFREKILRECDEVRGREKGTSLAFVLFSAGLESAQRNGHKISSCFR